MSLLDEINDRDIYVVVTERDTVDPMEAQGAIVMETYISKSDLTNALKSAINFSRYGQNVICKLVPLSNDEIKAINKAENK